MKKIPSLSIITCLIFIINSCNKIDFPHPPSLKDCDYRTAITNYLYRGQEVFVDSPLFTKHYIKNTHQLDYISTRFQGAVGTTDQGSNLFVHYAGLHTYYVTEANDTLVTLNYNILGRLATATAYPDMLVDGTPGIASLSDFRFNYTSGKIASIERKDHNGSAWEAYINFYYSADYSNLTKIVYNLSHQPQGTATFTYNLTKTVNHQYYPDQHAAFPFYFFSFIKYLNIFPELLLKNLLLTYNFHDPVLGDDTHAYKKQKFDTDGNLISYSYGSGSVFPPQPIEHWIIKWSCCDVIPKTSN